jgi:uncharacterized protein (TIGR02001 family)
VLQRSVVVVGALAFNVATGALAQVSGSVSLLSDYRFRGVSLSSERPAAQVDINYDATSGWYAGAFISSVRFDSYPSLNRLLLTYAGYTRRIGPDLSVDTGLTYADLSSGGDFDYLEAHAGVTTRLINVQVAFSPRYFGQRRAGTYLELNSGTQLTEMLRLFGHAGVLYVRPEPYQSGASTQVDGRIGLRYERESFSAQLSRVAATRISVIYPVESSQRRGAWVLQLARFF